MGSLAIDLLNQLTGFYMVATFNLNELMDCTFAKKRHYFKMFRQ